MTDTVEISETARLEEQVEDLLKDKDAYIKHIEEMQNLFNQSKEANREVMEELNQAYKDLSKEVTQNKFLQDVITTLNRAMEVIYDKRTES